jgi:hypothetical protein
MNEGFIEKEMERDELKKRKRQGYNPMAKRKKRNSYSQIEVEKVNTAYYLISQSFPNPFRNTYLRGKTEFRDFLYEKMGCSLLEAEIMVDVLEKDGKIEFRRFGKAMRYGTWEIHNKP